MLFKNFPHITDQMWNTLTDLEQFYFMIMQSRSGTLLLKGSPGHAKSAIVKTIADKLGFRYMYFSLTSKDAADIGCYPDPNATYNGENVLAYKVPKWAMWASLSSSSR